MEVFETASDRLERKNTGGVKEREREDGAQD
jgi:hypothetical protein